MARRTLRKHPGLVGAVTVLPLIAGLLISTGLIVMTQHGAYLDRKAAECGSPDAVALMPQGEQADAVADALRSGFLFYDIDSAPRRQMPH